MSYQYITQYDSPNFGYPMGTRGQNRPEEIVIHHWGSDKSTFGGTISWLLDPASEVSAHFVVEAGQVACLVNWNDAAWHAGDREVNLHSIGIECHPRCSAEDRETVAELIAMLWHAYGKLPLVGHQDVVSTGCPGRWYAHLGELTDMAEAIYSGDPDRPQIEVDGVWGYDTTLAAQKKLGLAAQDGVLSNQYSGNLDACIRRSSIHEGGWKFVDHVSDVGSDTVRAIQHLIGVEEDGVFGPSTVTALQQFLGVPADGVLGEVTVSAWQNWLNRV